MTTISIDKAIEQYVTERKKSSRKAAESKFITYTYLASGENDVVAFMKRIRGLACYYIDFLSVLENPLRGPQAAWLALIVVVFSIGIFMLTDDDLRLAGIFITSGTLVNGISLGRIVAAKWLETGVMIALYREIVDLIDNRLLAD
jgi:hypothetical protein